MKFLFLVLLMQPREVCCDTLEFVIPPGATIRILRNEFVQLDTCYHTYRLPNDLREKIPQWLHERLEWNLEQLRKVELRLKGPLYPSAGDINEDGIPDLILGDGEGKIHVYLGPDYRPADTIETGLSGPVYPAFGRQSGKPVIVIGSNDGFLRVYSADFERKIAERKIANSAVYPCFSGNQIFAGTDEGVLYRLKIKGKRIKSKKFLSVEGRVVPLSKGDTLYLLMEDGIYTLIDKKPTKYLSGKFDGFPAFLDADADGMEDLVFGDDSTLGYYRNTGAGYLVPDTTYRILFPFKSPLAIAPYPLSKDSILAGNGDGTLLLFIRNGNEFRAETLLTGYKYCVPYITGYDRDGKNDLLLGCKDGKIYLFRDFDLSKPEMLDLSVESYSAPCIFNGELITGSIDGKIYNKNGALYEINVGHSSIPDAGDINGDGMDDLVVGGQDGKIHVFLSPEYREDSSLVQVVGELAAPRLVDLNNDGLLDIVAGNLDGEVFYFENIGAKDSPRFLEKYSWKFQPRYRTTDLLSYYENYMPPRFHFLVAGDNQTLKKCLDLLRDCSDEIIDEVAFTIAYTPSEVLRAMARMDELSLIRENASLIYKMADTLKYVDIKECGDYTTLVYDGKYELPKEYYYFYVVHPRILYEIPAYVDASYWDNPPEYYGISEDDWLTKEIDVYRNKDKGVFWRSFFLRDRKYGKTLLEAVQDADSLWDAVFSIYMLQTWNKENPVMKFGYKTQDLQPVVIYKKAYGSCGEQSILFAAFARTALIPVYVVTDRGEDHQWNEFWDKGKWHHLDVNMKADKALDHPFVSSEGMSNKTVSCVTGWRGDDFMFDVTERGYTDTAVVEIRVVDKKGKPVDGAIVIVRSHWDNRNSIANWKYTDTEGKVKFGLGYQPLGYTIEILSPIGTAGCKNLFIEEGKSYSFTFELPGTLLERDLSSSEVPDIKVKTTASWQELRNFITGKPYRIRNAWLRDTIGYRGTRWFINPLDDTASPVVRIASDTIFVTNPSLLTFKKVMLLRKREDVAKPPAIEIVSYPKSVRLGEKAEVRLHVTDNLKLRALYVSEDGGKSFEKLSVPEGDTLVYVWDTGDGGPLFPGEYRLVFRAEDCDGNVSETEPIIIHVEPTNRFIAQKVYQDDPESDEPSASWIYGPIKVEDTLRFLLIWTEAPEAEGLDLDLFLYYDKNGNGKLDGKKELLKSSTSPFNTERIYVEFPKPGYYWIYAQGCTVENEPSLFNLYTSFIIDENGIVRE